MSTIIDIAEAVKVELNAGGFSQPFTAVRYYDPVFDLGDMKILHVSVVPTARDWQKASRSAMQDDVSIDIAIQKKVEEQGDFKNATLDALVALVQEIADHFAGHRLTACPDAMWLRATNVPVYSVEHLRELRQFTSVLTLTFRVCR
jgi:hypothetical protein